jgi:hypothetical protein
MNDHLVLVSGKSASGKSASLMFMDDPKGVMYLNCESGKKLPFKSKFAEYVITDPMQIVEAIEAAEGMENIHTIVVDSLTYLMDMYETQYVLSSTNTMKAWGDYAQYFKKLMQHYVAKSTKNIVFTAHTSDVMNDSEMAQETLVKIKGSVMNQGVESYFSTVISTKKVALKQLKNYTNSLLTITPEEEALGYKYVFQTRLTKESVNERIRSPLSMWNIQETYIDNNLQNVFNRLKDYYA